MTSAVTADFWLLTYRGQRPERPVAVERAVRGLGGDRLRRTGSQHWLPPRAESSGGTAAARRLRLPAGRTTGPAAAAGSRSSSPSSSEGSAFDTPAPTTHRPAARWSGSTSPSRSRSVTSPGSTPCGNSKTSWTASASTTTRPHRALGRSTPQQAYNARPKAVPIGTPLDDTHYRIRHDRIDPSGVFTLRHNSRPHHIGLAAGTPEPTSSSWSTTGTSGS